MLFAVPIEFEVVELANCLAKMFDVFLAFVFDAEVIDNECEGDVSPLVTKKTISRSLVV